MSVRARAPSLQRLFCLFILSVFVLTSASPRRHHRTLIWVRGEREREIKEGQEGKLQEHSDDAHTRLKSTSLAYPGRGEWAQRGRAQAPTPARARVQAPALEQELPAAAAAAALSEAKDSEKAEGGECGAQLHEANLSPSYSTGCKRCSSSCKLSGMSVRARANALSNGKRVTCDIGGGGFWDATPLKGLGLTP